MTPSQKAHDTKVFAFARSVVAEMEKHQHSYPNPDVVVEIFKDIRASSRVKGDAYEVMDREYHRFGQNTLWHSALRGCRNHPTHGPRLFGLFY